MASTRTRIAASIAAAAGIAALAAAPASAAPADIECKRAGVAVLQERGLFLAAAQKGITVGAAVGLGVGVRGDNPVPPLDTTLSLGTIISDHLKGDNSYFTYPWCG